MLAHLDDNPEDATLAHLVGDSLVVMREAATFLHCLTIYARETDAHTNIPSARRDLEAARVAFDVRRREASRAVYLASVRYVGSLEGAASAVGRVANPILAALQCELEDVAREVNQACMRYAATLSVEAARRPLRQEGARHA